MIKIEELLEQWSRDCIIDETNINRELLNIPKLHAKYIQYIFDYKKAALKNKFEYDKLKNIKTEYYSGNLDYETLKEYGWEPFDLKLLKNGVERYLSSDEDLIKLLHKKSYYEQGVSLCESILGELKSRTFQLRAIIDNNKFLSGA